MVGHLPRLARQQPGGSGSDPPMDRTATSAAAAALTVKSLLGMDAFWGMRVRGRITARNSASAACSPASSSGVAGAVAAASSLVSSP